MTGDEPEVLEDLWAGVTDEEGFPIDIAPAEQVAAEAVAAGDETVRLVNLPEEFWGARDFFKTIRQAARSEGRPPDGVLGAALARVSAMVSPNLKFHTNSDGCFNLFVNLIAPSGIGKTTSMQTAKKFVLAPTHLLDDSGEVDWDRFRDGVALGSGEGMAEAYMGTRERETGEMTRGRNPEPKMERYRTKTRDHAFLVLDEGETLTKMLERQGNTIGQAIRTAWTGASLGQANAQEITTRHVPEGTYAMGLLIGYQPKTAQRMLADAGGGTPQRFLWLSAVDPDFPDWPEAPPEPWRPPLCDGNGHPLTGTVEFPDDINRALWLSLRDKNKSQVIVDELDSHEPLMRSKLAALLCVLDGRMLVSADDWRLAGVLWAVSCATRDRLLEFGRQQKAAEEAARREALVADVEASTAAKLRVNDAIVGLARRIARHVNDEFEPVRRSPYRRDLGSRYKPIFDDALAYAVARGWVSLIDDGARLGPGDSAPS